MKAIDQTQILNSCSKHKAYQEELLASPASEKHGNVLVTPSAGILTASLKCHKQGDVLENGWEAGCPQMREFPLSLCLTAAASGSDALVKAVIYKA